MTGSYGNNVYSEDSYKIPFTNSSGLILLEAEIEGQLGFFVFDTGADVTLFNKEALQFSDAQKLDLVPQPISTLTGTMQVGTATVSNIKLGNYVLNDLEVYHTDLSQIGDSVDGTLFGILGSNVFSSQVLHIDNVNRIIELYDSQFLNRNANANRYYKVPLEIVNDMILVPLTIGEKQYQFALDTGSSVSLIDNKVLKENPDIHKLNKQLRINTANDQLSTQAYEIGSSALSQIKINSLQFGVADMSLFESMPDDFSGILSIEQLPFTELIIDFNNNLLHFSF